MIPPKIINKATPAPIHFRSVMPEQNSAIVQCCQDKFLTILQCDNSLNSQIEQEELLLDLYTETKVLSSICKKPN